MYIRHSAISGTVRLFDENFLMTVATFGAFGVGEYSEAVAVMLFLSGGRTVPELRGEPFRQSITELMDICPEYANIEEDGQLKQVDPDDVQVGDIIVVKAGERIPLDGKVVFGNSMVDTSALTGESVPRRWQRGTISSAAVSTAAAFCGFRSQKNLMIPQWPRFWNWWRMPAAKKPMWKTSSPGLPDIIPLWW